MGVVDGEITVVYVVDGEIIVVVWWWMVAVGWLRRRLHSTISTISTVPPNTNIRSTISRLSTIIAAFPTSNSPRTTCGSLSCMGMMPTFNGPLSLIREGEGRKRGRK
jgi:hypothetical protein